MGYYIDQLAEQDRQKRLADLLAMQQDNSDPGVSFDVPQQPLPPQGTIGDLMKSGASRDEINAMLSQSTQTTPGYQGAGFMAGTPYIPREPGYGGAGTVEQAPPNMIRNNRTGRTFSPTDRNGQPSQSQAAGPALDYSSPIDIGGYGKGYRLKGDATRAVMADGRIVSMGRDTAAERAATKENLALDAQRATIAHTEAQTRATGTKPDTTPAGYRKTATGNLEVIPGGPADLKMAGQYNADTAQLNGSVSGMDRLAVAANEALQHPGLAGTAGLRGAFPNIPGSDAANAAALLNTLKSQVAFSVLQDMRNNSKTGGALGQVSDKEGQLLQSNLAALDKSQSVEQLQDNLKKIIDYTQGAKDRFGAAFNLKHGEGAITNPSRLPAATAAPAVVPPVGVAVQVTSVNDAMKLPSGTKFIDPNGVMRVRP